VDDDEHQDLRTNPFQGGGYDESTLSLTHDPYAPQGSSPIKGLIQEAC